MAAKGIFLGTTNFSAITKVPSGGYFFGFDSNNGGLMSKIDSALVITVIEGGGAAVLVTNTEGLNIPNSVLVTSYVVTGISAIIAGQKEVGGAIREGILANTNTNLIVFSAPVVTSIFGKIEFFDCSALVSISMPLLTSLKFESDCSFDTLPLLTTLNLNSLAQIVYENGNINIIRCDVLTSLNLPVLTSIEAVPGGTATLSIRNNNLMTSVLLPLLENAATGGNIEIQITDLLVLNTINLDSLTNMCLTGGELRVETCPLLATISLPELLNVFDLIVTNMAILSSLSIPVLALSNSIRINTCSALTTISAPVLAINTTDIIIDSNPVLVTINLVQLTIADNILINTHVLLTTITLTNLAEIGTSIQIEANDIITSVALPALVTCNGGFINITLNPALTTITLNAAIDCTTFDFSANALSEANVDAILALLDAGGELNGTIDMSLGTNSAPSAAGLVSAGNLTGKGWTVTVNP